MVVFGIDPGYERLGWSCVRREGSRLEALGYGLIRTPIAPMPHRLSLIHDELSSLLAAWRPDAIATERQLFAANKTTALDVAKALGVVLLVAERHGLTWSEYTPAEVKQAVVGHGAADKRQIQFMVMRLLGLEVAPKPDDVADALAIAICHMFRSRLSPPAPKR